MAFIALTAFGLPVQAAVNTMHLVGSGVHTSFSGQSESHTMMSLTASGGGSDPQIQAHTEVHVQQSGPGSTGVVINNTPDSAVADFGTADVVPNAASGGVRAEASVTKAGGTAEADAVLDAFVSQTNVSTTTGATIFTNASAHNGANGGVSTASATASGDAVAVGHTATSDFLAVSDVGGTAMSSAKVTSKNADANASAGLMASAGFDNTTGILTEFTSIWSETGLFGGKGVANAEAGGEILAFATNATDSSTFLGAELAGAVSSEASGKAKNGSVRTSAEFGTDNAEQFGDAAANAEGGTGKFNARGSAEIQDAFLSTSEENLLEGLSFESDTMGLDLKADVTQEGASTVPDCTNAETEFQADPYGISLTAYATAEGAARSYSGRAEAIGSVDNASTELSITDPGNEQHITNQIEAIKENERDPDTHETVHAIAEARRTGDAVAISGIQSSPDEGGTGMFTANFAETVNTSDYARAVSEAFGFAQTNSGESGSNAGEFSASSDETVIGFTKSQALARDSGSSSETFNALGTSGFELAPWIGPSVDGSSTITGLLSFSAAEGDNADASGNAEGLVEARADILDEGPGYFENSSTQTVALGKVHSDASADEGSALSAAALGSIQGFIPLWVEEIVPPVTTGLVTFSEASGDTAASSGRASGDVFSVTHELLQEYEAVENTSIEVTVFGAGVRSAVDVDGGGQGTSAAAIGSTEGSVCSDGDGIFTGLPPVATGLFSWSGAEGDLTTSAAESTGSVISELEDSTMLPLVSGLGTENDGFFGFIDNRSVETLVLGAAVHSLANAQHDGAAESSAAIGSVEGISLDEEISLDGGFIPVDTELTSCSDAEGDFANAASDSSGFVASRVDEFVANGPAMTRVSVETIIPDAAVQTMVDVDHGGAAQSKAELGSDSGIPEIILEPVGVSQLEDSFEIPPLNVGMFTSNEAEGTRTIGSGAAAGDVFFDWESSDVLGPIFTHNQSVMAVVIDGSVASDVFVKNATEESLAAIGTLACFDGPESFPFVSTGLVSMNEAEGDKVQASGDAAGEVEFEWNDTYAEHLIAGSSFVDTSDGIGFNDNRSIESEAFGAVETSIGMKDGYADAEATIGSLVLPLPEFPLVINGLAVSTYADAGRADIDALAEGASFVDVRDHYTEGIVSDNLSLESEAMGLVASDTNIRKGYGGADAEIGSFQFAGYDESGLTEVISSDSDGYTDARKGHVVTQSIADGSVEASNEFEITNDLVWVPTSSFIAAIESGTSGVASSKVELVKPGMGIDSLSAAASPSFGDAEAAIVSDAEVGFTVPFANDTGMFGAQTSAAGKAWTAAEVDEADIDSVAFAADGTSVHLVEILPEDGDAFAGLDTMQSAATLALSPAVSPIFAFGPAAGPNQTAVQQSDTSSLPMSAQAYWQGTGSSIDPHPVLQQWTV